MKVVCVGDCGVDHYLPSGERRFGSVEIVSGLEEGELIVTEGIVKLRDGTRVRTAESATEARSFNGAGG